MKSTETMTKDELYNTAACDYDSIYLSQVRIVYSDYQATEYATCCLQICETFGLQNSHFYSWNHCLQAGPRGLA